MDSRTLCSRLKKRLFCKFISNLFGFSNACQAHCHLFSARIQPGGKYSPRHCRPRNKIAIIVPLQNRDAQLSILAAYLHTFLNAQLIDYQLFVVELSRENRFNKGALYNAGFLGSMTR